MDPTPMEALLTSLGSIADFLIGAFVSVLSLFTEEPILTFMFGIMVTGAIIGLSMRVVRRR